VEAIIRSALKYVKAIMPTVYCKCEASCSLIANIAKYEDWSIAFAQYGGEFCGFKSIK
jgi:hypothetical protein